MERRKLVRDTRDVLEKLDDAIHNTKLPGSADSDINVFAIEYPIRYGILDELRREIVRLRKQVEPAHFFHIDGRETFASVVRFDPFMRDDMAGMASTNENQSIWVSVSELQNPMIGDGVNIGGAKFEVRQIEPHKLRGYHRLYLSEIY